MKTQPKQPLAVDRGDGVYVLTPAGVDYFLPLLMKCHEEKKARVSR